MNNALIVSLVAGVIRHGLTALGVLLMKYGVTASQASGIQSMVNVPAVAGFLVTAGSLAWSTWHKTSVNTQLVTAGALPSSTVNPAVSKP